MIGVRASPPSWGTCVLAEGPRCCSQDRGRRLDEAVGPGRSCISGGADEHPAPSAARRRSNRTTAASRGSSASTSTGDAAMLRATVTSRCSASVRSSGSASAGAVTPTRARAVVAAAIASWVSHPSSSRGSAVFSSTVSEGTRRWSVHTVPTSRRRSAVASATARPSSVRSPMRGAFRTDVITAEAPSPVTATTSPASTRRSEPPWVVTATTVAVCPRPVRRTCRCRHAPSLHPVPPCRPPSSVHRTRPVCTGPASARERRCRVVMQRTGGTVPAGTAPPVRWVVASATRPISRAASTAPRTRRR